MPHSPLKRVLGAPTALLLGMGVAIGSGIFRTPGDVAASLQWPALILLAWVLGGMIAVIQGLVTAELATRFPQAGGEYVYLREAYGRFVAFFFGWAYTLFVIGGGAATISSAFGDFACELLDVSRDRAGLFAAGAIVAVTGVNVIGLRVGAGTQNIVTGLKIAALVVVAVAGLALGGRGAAGPALSAVDTVPTSWAGLFLAAVLSVRWSYDGTTDAVKMAEEVRDTRRSLPIGVIGSALALMILYVGVNAAMLCVLRPDEMAGLASVPGEAMARLFGPAARKAMLLVAMFVCVGSLGSTVLATIRVTFALARDGLTFGFLARMSMSQAPVAALLVVAGFAVVLVLNRDFAAVLRIYYFASAILFGLSYASLIIFRRRDRQARRDIFRCPFGVVLASLLILLEGSIAFFIARDSPSDAAMTAVLLAALGLLYVVWRRLAPRSGPVSGR
ncbi:MAG: APC family permease [Phycisphaerae bacterium]